jgi:hypothetical protein
MDEPVLTPDYPPADWSPPDTGPPAATVCTCSVPVPVARATSKGAARTYCGRCDLPVRIAFDLR